MEPFRYPGNKISRRTQVFNLIKTRSFGRGEITLASGKKSNFYFNMKPTMLSAEGAALLPHLILEAIEDKKPDLVGGLAVGAVPLLTPVVIQSLGTSNPIHNSFFVRPKPKDHGTRDVIEGLTPDELAGKTVVVLDDVTTTGGSAMIAVNAAKAAGASVVLVLAIVDREEGAAEFFKQQGIEFRSIFRASEFLNS
jgi:orotate phosphoribosyltransferase